MKIELFIALRHIRERKRQSFFAILGIIIGISVLMVSIAISNGLDKNMISGILSMTTHIKLTNSTVTVENYNELSEKLSKIKGVKGVMPRYSSQGLVKYDGFSGAFTTGVVINGLTQKGAKEVLGLDKKIIKGKLDLDDTDSILLGKELFDQIGAIVGDRIKVISPENKKIFLKITGVYQSGNYDFDTTMVIIPLKTVQFLSESGDSATELSVMLNDLHKANNFVSVLEKESGLQARTWGEMNRPLLSALALEKIVMIIIFSLIVIIAGFVVGVILNMLVREKTKDIGIMRSMGYSRKNIMKIFLYEGGILGGLGIIKGTIVSLIIIKILDKLNLKKLSEVYYLDKIPVEISWEEIGIIILATSIVVFISSIFPAYKAARLKPVEALKYE